MDEDQVVDKPIVHVVGLHGGSWFGDRAADAIYGADVVVGAKRLSDQLASDVPGQRVELFGPLDEVIDLIEDRSKNGEKVTMLASGDPGFFGIGRLLVGRFGNRVRLHPAPSSVAMAFARAGVPWDDASVVSCHGRSLDRALPSILAAPKVAVLVSASCPPQALGQALIEAQRQTVTHGDSDIHSDGEIHSGDEIHSHVWVCSRLGEAEETVTKTDVAGLAAGSFDPLSIVVLATDALPLSPEASLRWGRPVSGFDRRKSMITKPEVRAVVLSKLELKGSATLWDVGAGSGSVAIEAARLAPGLRGYAIERRADDCDRIRRNATRVAVSVVEGEAPACFEGLPDPDRLFIGGGGIDVFRAGLKRLRPGGVVVATFAIIESALAAASELHRADGSALQSADGSAIPRAGESGMNSADGSASHSADGSASHSADGSALHRAGESGAEDQEMGSMVQVSINKAVSVGSSGRLRFTADNPVFVVWGTKS